MLLPLQKPYKNRSETLWHLLYPTTRAKASALLMAHYYHKMKMKTFGGVLVFGPMLPDAAGTRQDQGIPPSPAKFRLSLGPIPTVETLPGAGAYTPAQVLCKNVQNT